jgi:glycosidase
MKVKYYPNLFLNFLIFLVLFESYTSIQEFYDNVKYDFGHWVIYEMNVGAFTTEGTFNAAAQKLEDLKSLGIDIIWLMPIYTRDGGLNSPYAARDFKTPNPSYGTVSDLKNFVSKAHELKMEVWLDWVPNHTANNHPWLNEHPEYYASNLHPYYPDVSQLNYENSALRKTMTDILKFWIDQANIDGFRCDFISSPYIPNDYWTSTIPE